MRRLAHVRITPEATVLNGEVISKASIGGLYRDFVGDYPKFFKMDALCKLGFLGAELLLRDLSPQEKEHISIVLFNRNSSLITDRVYQQTLAEENYFPSPALFVYTLANIVTGEIAIRHKIYGETSFYVSDSQDQDLMESVVSGVFETSSPPFVLMGWVDYDHEGDYLADMALVTK